MKIGILTSGGDAPGMNAILYKLISSVDNDTKIIAFINGYQGLIENNFIVLEKKLVMNCSHLGGSIIKSGRSEEFKTKQGFKKALTNIILNKLNLLIILGGDGSFKGAKELIANDIKVIFVPCTIDNDLEYSTQTLGFDSAVNAVVESFDKIKQTMLSNNRIFLCEVMGRHCPDIAKTCFKATDSTYLISKKQDLNLKKIYKSISIALEKGEEAPSIIVKENLVNIYNLAKDIQNYFDIETRACQIGYIQRGTQPSVFDRIYARDFVIEIINCIKQNINNVALGIKNNEIFKLNLRNDL